MSDDAAAVLTNSRVVAAYRERTPGSAKLAAEARGVFPSGITHDARHLDPYGVYIARAQGPHKWDVDGNRYVDFFGGHGSLILGHGRAEVIAAVNAALTDGTQFGASHPREIAWARAIMRLVPSAERVRFTSSGTEATLMAVRLARAFTGRSKLLRFKGHFHGWHDQMTSGYTDHFDGSATPGVLAGVADENVLVAPGDIDAVRAALAAGDVAAAILEPTGSSFGQVPLRPEFLHQLREATERQGTLLIFDEVVTGFRVAPGGAQAAFGVRPDLSSFAKIVAGGMPGAAVAGRRDVLDWLDFDASRAAGREKIGHPGTFNANPVAAAAGVAALTLIAETDVCGRADRSAAALRDGLNDALAQEGVPWAVYGTSSGFHLFMDPLERGGVQPGRFDPFARDFAELKAGNKALINKMRLAMLANGVDLNPRLGGLLSDTHAATDLDDTVGAFRAALRMLHAEGELPRA
ncbi:MAG: aminotransferase class III-fold pyridoxal phosphate-dependent enzyme [Acetobacteraceae bacterium]|nr:aminotransferase class III-fold pyridoxal phosphate-dependent enzyme [Acetobacteraceae bacterium]